MAIVHATGSDTVTGSASQGTERSRVRAEDDRLANRAYLRSCTRRLLSELGEQLYQSFDDNTRAVVTQRMRDARDQLVAALSGDEEAIESLSARYPEPLDRLRN